MDGAERESLSGRAEQGVLARPVLNKRKVTFTRPGDQSLKSELTLVGYLTFCR